MAASYSILTTSGTLVVLPDAVDTTSSSLALVGQNSNNWGGHINQNFVDVLTHNARKSRPNFPMKGEMWFDQAINQMMVYVGTSVANPTGWIKINASTEAGANSDLLNHEPGSYYLNLANSTGTLPVARLSGTYAISVSGNAATATNAADSVNAQFVRRDGSPTGQPMTFLWTDGVTQPPWVWGGTDGITHRVYNPAGFSVSSATKLTTPRSISVSGNATGSVLFDGTGNVDIPLTVVSSGKLTTARTISLTGEVTGSVAFDGSANVSMPASVPGLGSFKDVFALPVGAVTLTTADFGKFVAKDLLGQSTSVTVPSPTGNGGKSFTFWNYDNTEITVSTPTGLFVRPGSIGASNTTRIPKKCTASITSDGTNWIVNNLMYGTDSSSITPNTVPVSAIMYFPVGFVPDGWLKCNGAAISRTVYDSLFWMINTQYGTGNGTSTFNIPDLRGEFIRGWDDGRGVDSGRVIGSWQGDAIRNIYGTLDANTDDAGRKTGAFYDTGGGRHTGANGDSTGDGGGTVAFDASRVVPTSNENRPRNVAMMACIKY